MKNGDTLQLQHYATSKFLHSHLHTSPLTGQQEVSAYDGGDTGDNWELLTVNSAEWKSDTVVRLKHVDTGKFLMATTATFGNPIPGQHEIVASNGGAPALWLASEGIFFPVHEEEKQTEED